MDRFSGNIKSEKSIQHDDMSWQKHIQFCEVHIVSQSNRHALDLLSSDMSGLLSLALSQAGGGALRTMRDILSSTLKDRLEISYTAPPGDTVARHREAVHNLFLPLPKKADRGGLSTVLRRYVLKTLFNSDLTSSSVTHHCAWGCCSSPEETLEKVTLWGCWALLPHKLPKFAKTRWTNQQKSLHWASLLEAHHQLLAAVVTKFTGTPTPSLECAADSSIVAAQGGADDNDSSDGGDAYLQAAPLANSDQPGMDWEAEAGAAAAAVDVEVEAPGPGERAEEACG